MSRIRTAGALAVACVALGVLSAAKVQAQSPPQYDLVKTVSLGAPDRWDYLTFDAPSHRVYVSHGDRVTVVDSRDGSILGQVEGFAGGTHGIAVVARSGKGYTDDGRNGLIGAFDLKTFKTGATIKGAEDADGMVLDAASGHVFVANGDSGSVSVVDPGKDALLATIPVGEKLEFLVAGPGGKVYVNGAEKQDIVRIDTHTNSVDVHWPVPTCTSPHGLAMDTATHRLFTSCINSQLVVVNADSGAVVATLPIGAGSDAVAFDPRRRRIFSSNGRDGDITVIEEKSPDSYTVLGSIKTGATARTMALDPDTGRLFVAAADVDAQAPAANGRPRLVPGSLKLLFLDPKP